MMKEEEILGVWEEKEVEREVGKRTEIWKN